MLAMTDIVFLAALLFCKISAAQAPNKRVVDARYTNTSSVLVPSQTGVPGVTLNAISPVFEWWYNSTAHQTVSTVSLQFDTDDVATGWTLIAPSTTYDTATAISTFACATTPTTTTFSNGLSYTYTSCGTVPVHVAAATTAIFLNAYFTPNETSGTDPHHLPKLAAPTPPAQLVIPGASTTVSPRTAVVYFSSYEVISVGSCDANSPESCASTATSTLANPYVFDYTGPDPLTAQDVDAIVTGALDPAFPAFVHQPSAIAGTWAAAPTVIVVVVRIIIAVAVLAAHIEQSASELIVPTAHIEGSATSLVVPLSTYASRYTVLSDLNGQDYSQLADFGTTRATDASATAGSGAGSNMGAGTRSATTPTNDSSPGQYIATGIGATRPDGEQTQATGASQSSLNGQGAAATSGTAYLAGSSATSASSSLVALIVSCGSMLLALGLL